jgi:hypothetical protein
MQSACQNPSRFSRQEQFHVFQEDKNIVDAAASGRPTPRREKRAGRNDGKDGRRERGGMKGRRPERQL